MKRTLLIVMLAACHTFQDPDVVVDLRVLAMDSTVPEQVIDVDLVNPPPADQILDQLVPSTVCALVSDPNFDRRLRWTLTLCVFGDYERCDIDYPLIVIGSGLEDDPDLTPAPEPTICGTVPADADLLGIVLDSLQGDELHGLQGVDYEVQLEVGGETADPSLDLYAAKTLQLANRNPPSRVANNNPYLTEVDATIGDRTPTALPLGRCVDQAVPLTVSPGAKVRLTPIEPPGVREQYVIPTLDGSFEMFTESLTYQWTVSAGSFTDGSTGGPPDRVGNIPVLYTDWTAPSAEDLKGPTDVSLWVVQRDERYGVHWYESCVQVVP